MPRSPKPVQQPNCKYKKEGKKKVLDVKELKPRNSHMISQGDRKSPNLAHKKSRHRSGSDHDEGDISQSTHKKINLYPGLLLQA